MNERLSIGDKVRIKSEPDPYFDETAYAGQEVTVVDVEGPYYLGDLTHYVRADDGEQFWAYDKNLDIEVALAQKSNTVTLTQEQAYAVRKALEALYWTPEDLGPLTHVQQPVHTFEVTVPTSATAGDVKAALLEYGVTATVEPVN